MVSVLRSPVAVRCGSDHRTTICYQNHNILGNECVTSTTSAETRQTAREAEVAVEGGGTCGAARASGRAAQRRPGARNVRERMLRVKHPAHHRDDPYPPRVSRPRPPRWGAVGKGAAAAAPAAFRPLRFGLPHVRKNRTFGNRSFRIPAAKNSDLGFRHPKSRRRRPATARQGKRLPKVGFLRTWGGEDATVRTLTTDAPTGSGFAERDLGLRAKGS